MLVTSQPNFQGLIREQQKAQHKYLLCSYQLSLQIIGQNVPVGDPMFLITLKLFIPLPYIYNKPDAAPRTGSLNQASLMS